VPIISLPLVTSIITHILLHLQVSESRPHRSRGRSSGISHPLISRHPSETPIDATSLQLRHIREIIANQAQNQLILHDLDFVDMGGEMMINLFYNRQRHEKRFLDGDGTIILPPMAQRRTSSQIIAFVELGKKQKQEVLAKYSGYVIDTSNRVKYTESHIVLAHKRKTTSLYLTIQQMWKLAKSQRNLLPLLPFP
jgi:hypothetical protein